MVHKQLEQPITLKEKKIIEKIDNAAQIIINEIELQNENKGTISNMFQLEKILNELNQMKLSLSKKIGCGFNKIEIIIEEIQDKEAKLF